MDLKSDQASNQSGEAMDLNVNINVKFLNSIMGTPPPWAVELNQMVADFIQQGIQHMAKAEEKLAELEAAFSGLQGSLAGISGDLQTLNEQNTANAAEIAALKQEVINAGTNELSEETLSRFDALKQSITDAATLAAELDARLPNVVPTPPAEPEPTTPEPVPEPALEPTTEATTETTRPREGGF